MVILSFGQIDSNTSVIFFLAVSKTWQFMVGIIYFAHLIRASWTFSRQDDWSFFSIQMFQYWNQSAGIPLNPFITDTGENNMSNNLFQKQ